MPERVLGAYHAPSDTAARRPPPYLIGCQAAGAAAHLGLPAAAVAPLPYRLDFALLQPHTQQRVNGREIVTEANRQLMAEFEKRLREAAEEERAQIALPLAAVATEAVEIDLTQASEEAGAYLESFPVPGRAVVDLADQCARWLALRIATDERRARLRQALVPLAEAWPDRYPLASQALGGLVAALPPSDPKQDELWLALARAIVEEQMGRLSW